MFGLASKDNMAANAIITHYNDQGFNSLPNLLDWKSLMLCWHSFSDSGREHVAVSFTYNNSLYLIYECRQPFATQINHDASPEVIDDLLRLIFWIVQVACCVLFRLSQLHILHFWMSGSNHHSDYPRCKTKHFWYSIHFPFRLGRGVYLSCY